MMLEGQVGGKTVEVIWDDSKSMEELEYLNQRV